MDEYKIPCCVRGYYIDIWIAVVGEELICETETMNANDRYAIAVVKNEITIRHLSRKVSKICSLFLMRGAVSDRRSKVLK